MATLEKTPLLEENDSLVSQKLLNAELGDAANVMNPPIEEKTAEIRNDEIADQTAITADTNNEESKSITETANLSPSTEQLEKTVDEKDETQLTGSTEINLNNSEPVVSLTPQVKRMRTGNEENTPNIPKPDASQTNGINGISHNSAIANGNKNSKLTREQTKYVTAILRTIKRSRDAGPFLEPVDPIKLNVPDYLDIIKTPMDLSTVEKKLNEGEYINVDQFVDDIKLIFDNCYKYNGDENKSLISKMARNLESTFLRQLKQMPSNSSDTEQNNPQKSSSASTKKRSSSTSINKSYSSPSSVSRPKRAVHPPAFREMPYIESKPKRKKVANQLRFCGNILRELKKKQYESIAYPFYYPVDPVALKIPDYTKIVKKPMDLSTIQNKYNSDIYNTPEEFEEDIRLMFKNCYLFNPAGSPVHVMGKKFEAIFDQKWREMPKETAQPSFAEDMSASSEELSDEDDALADLNKKISSLKQAIRQMQAHKAQKLSKHKRKDYSYDTTSSPRRKTTTIPIITKEMQDRFVRKMSSNVTPEETDVILQVLKEYMQIPESGELELEPSEMAPECFIRIYRFLFKGEDPMRKVKKFQKPRKRGSLSEKEQVDRIKTLQAQLAKFGDSPSGRQSASSSLAVHSSSDESEEADNSDQESSEEE